MQDIYHQPYETDTGFKREWTMEERPTCILLLAGVVRKACAPNPVPGTPQFSLQPGFRVYGVQGLGFNVWGLGFRA